MAEIRAVLTKHDLCGVVLVASRTHTEYEYKLDATWTCMRDDPNAPGAVRIKASSKVPAEAEQMRLTVGTVQGMLDVLRRNASELGKLMATLAKHVTFEHRSTFEKPPEN